MIIDIDGRKCECEPGEILLAVAKRCGIFIPTLCHHEGLPGQGACRVCIVEAEDQKGRRTVVTACAFPVEQGYHFYVNSEKIKRERRLIYDLLAARAPERPGVASSIPPRFIRLDGEKCVLCGLCARACESVGTGAIATINRGTEKKVATPYDAPAADCIGCGSCAAVCPTEAIAVEETASTRTIWHKTFELTHCANCGAITGTREEREYAAQKSGGSPTALCESCRKKAMTDVLASTYGK